MNACAAAGTELTVWDAEGLPVDQAVVRGDGRIDGREEDDIPGHLQPPNACNLVGLSAIEVAVAA